MTRLTWEKPVNPRYETGVDRVVVYMMPTLVGIPWSGVISIDENIQGADRSDAFFDGVKYNDFVATRNYQAVLRAFDYPRYLSGILGYVGFKPGVFLTRQKRTEFRLSYRTMLGDGGYKIHLIYGCTLVPITRSYSTINDAPDPSIFEWTVNSIPEAKTSVRPWKPTAHLIIDSTKVSPTGLQAVEDQLYGNEAGTIFSTLDKPEVMLDLATS